MNLSDIISSKIIINKHSKSEILISKKFNIVEEWANIIFDDFDINIYPFSNYDIDFQKRGLILNDKNFKQIQNVSSKHILEKNLNYILTKKRQKNVKINNEYHLHLEKKNKIYKVILFRNAEKIFILNSLESNISIKFDNSKIIIEKNSNFFRSETLIDVDEFGNGKINFNGFDKKKSFYDINEYVINEDVLSHLLYV